MQGMIAAAHAVQIKLESERVLEKAFKENKVHFNMHVHICTCIYMYMYNNHYWGVSMLYAPHYMYVGIQPGDIGPLVGCWSG